MFLVQVGYVASQYVHVLGRLIHRVGYFPIVIVVRMSADRRYADHVLVRASIVFLFKRRYGHLFRHFCGGVVDLDGDEAKEVLVNSRRVICRQDAR